MGWFGGGNFHPYFWFNTYIQSHPQVRKVQTHESALQPTWSIFDLELWVHLTGRSTWLASGESDVEKCWDIKHNIIIKYLPSWVSFALFSFLNGNNMKQDLD